MPPSTTSAPATTIARAETTASPQLTLSCAPIVKATRRQYLSFDSSNKSRFSNTTGWISLDFFLHKIGPIKAAMLRKTTVCHLNFVIKPESITSQDWSRQGCLYLRLGGIIREGAFVHEKRWFEKSDIPCRPAAVLEKAGKLQQLCLTVPVCAGPGVVDDAVGDESKFENITVTFLGLHSKSVPSKWMNEPGKWVRDNLGTGRACARACEAKTAKACDGGDIFVDEVGFYRSFFMAGKKDVDTEIA